MTDRSPPNNNQLQRVKDIFHQAMDKPEADRLEFARQMCGSDQETLERVLELIQASGQTTGDLERIVQVAASEVTESQQEYTQIGSYRIIRELGKGGMGRVLLAERDDEQFQQLVAIKLVDHQSNPDLEQRFRSERQILADLSHPNIATLYDGGETADGRPYFVMEYVDGTPIDRHCDEHRLSTRQRLDLFLQVCHAVQHAHQNLVIHRDIKPSNILVTQEGVLKLLDFGIAKLIKPLTDFPQGITRADMRPMTPEHASPEQIRGDSITTATDVYALGVLLYQLLTGHFPYDISSWRPYEIEKAICESQPQKPSTVVTQSQGQTASSPAQISSMRKTSPPRLRRQLKGDLDNIVMVALRKEPERRYGTVRQMLLDVKHYLEDKPVSARGDAWTYHFGKFIKRNRWSVSGGLISVLLLSATVAFYTQRLAAERDLAELQSTRVAAVANFLTSLFSAADPRQALGETITAKELLERGARRIDQELAEQPAVRATLMTAIGESYLNMSEYAPARDLFDRALLINRNELQDGHPETTKVARLLATVVSQTGEFDKALEIHQDNLVAQTNHSGPDSSEVAATLQQIAFIQTKQGEYESAIKNFERAIEINRGLGEAGLVGLASNLMEYGSALRDMGRTEQEEALILEALAIRKQLYGDYHPEISAILNNIGNHYLDRGQGEKAVGFIRQTLEMNNTLYGEDSLPVAMLEMNLSNYYVSTANYEQALTLAQRARPKFLAKLGEDSPRYGFLLENLANILVSLNDYQEAEKLYAQSLEIVRAAFGEQHKEYAISMSNFGGFLLAAEKPQQAISWLESANRVFTETNGAQFPSTINARAKLGRAYHLTGQTDIGLAMLEDTLVIARESFAEPHVFLTNVIKNLGEANRDLGNFEYADDLFAENETLWRSMVKEDSSRITDAIKDRVVSLQKQNRIQDMQLLYETRRQQLVDLLGEEHQQTLDFEQWYLKKSRAEAPD